MVRHAATKASELALDPEEVRELFWRVVRMSREMQRDATLTAAANPGTTMPAPREAQTPVTGSRTG